MEEGSAPASLDGTLQVLFRYKRLMICFFLVVAAAGVALYLLTPPSYRSQAELLMRLGRENVTVDPTATVGQAAVVAVPQSRENEINSAIEILKGRALAERIVAAVGPPVILGRTSLTDDASLRPSSSSSPTEVDDKDFMRAVTRFSKSLDVEPVRKSDVIAIRYSSPDPKLCQVIVSRLIDFYLDSHLSLNRAPGADKFLKEQTTRLLGQLARTEADLRDLKNKTGVAFPDGERQIRATRIGRIEDELLQVSASAAATETEIRLLRERLAALPKTQVTAQVKNPADVLQGQLYALQLKEREMLTRYPEQHPEMRLLRQQIEAAKTALAKEGGSRDQITTGPSRTYEETHIALLRQEPVLGALRARVETLRTQLREEQAKLKTFNEDSLRVRKLERDYDLQELEYRKYAENLEQAQIDHALQLQRITNVSVIQPATYDPNPVGFRRLLLLGLCLVLAVGGSLALPFLLDRLDRSVKRSQDLEHRLGLAVLTSVPHLDGACSPLPFSAGNGRPSHQKEPPFSLPRKG
jgi:polysaccharide biosynthesis protein PslE